MAGSGMAGSEMGAPTVETTPTPDIVDLAPHRVGVPGTGVSLSLPADMELAALGPIFVDPEQDIRVVVLITSSERAAATAPGDAERFPHELDRPLPLEGRIAGRVRWRTREHDGGSFDGWQLRAERGGRTLSINALYTGDAEDEFRSLLGVLASVEWLPGREDNRAAMGVAFPPVAGLYPLDDAVGALAFAENPGADQSGAQLFLTVPGQRIPADTFDEGCAGLLAEEGQRAADHEPLRTEHFRGCTGTAPSPTDPGRAQYRAALRAEDGSILVAIGDVESTGMSAWRPRFADIIRALTPTRRRDER